MLENKKFDINTLMEIGMMFNKYFRTLQSKKKISMLKSDVLNFIMNNNNITMSELSHYLNSTQPALTKLINNMVEKGFIVKNRDLLDKRKFRLKCSLKGEKELNRIKGLIQKEMEKIYSILTSKDLKSYIIINKKLIENMKILILEYESI